VHDGELRDLCRSPNVIVMRWAGHVARVGARRDVGGVLVGKVKERNRVEDLSI
jgi:hypothetical protein